MGVWFRSAKQDDVDILLSDTRDKAINSEVTPTDYGKPYVSEGKLHIPGEQLLLNNLHDLLAQVHCNSDITPNEVGTPVLRIFLSDMHGKTF